MAGYVENANRVKNANDNIKQAIINKGVTPTGNLESYADAIASIPTGSGGVDVKDTTALRPDVLETKIFHLSTGESTTGTMTNNGAITKTLESDEVFTIPEGYHNGQGVIIAPHGGGGEVSVASGRTITNTRPNGGVTVECGFRPKRVIVYNGTGTDSATSGMFTTDMYWENDDGSIIQKLIGCNATGQIISNTANIEIYDTGFNHWTRSGKSASPIFYIAEG